MQPAGGPSVLTTSNNANVAMGPLTHQTWDAPSLAETISEPRAEADPGYFLGGVHHLGMA